MRITGNATGQGKRPLPRYANPFHPARYRRTEWLMPPLLIPRTHVA